MEPAEPTTSFEPVTLHSLYEQPEDMKTFVGKAERATYVVICPEATGSGFGLFVEEEDAVREYLITNHHVIESCLEDKVTPTIRDFEGIEHKVQVLYSASVESDADRYIVAQDIAILAAPFDRAFRSMPAMVDHQPLGSWVMTSSYPGLHDDYYTYAVTIGHIASDTLGDGFVLTAAINPGSSGGMVLNSRGQVIGVIYAGHDQTELNDAGLFLPIGRVQEAVVEMGSKKSL
jgi:S1-C subfamily serine protease